MSCQQAEVRLDEYLDGELSPQEMLAVREHVAECAACRARFAELGLIQQALSGTVHLPAASQRQILRRIETRSRRGWIAPVLELADSVYTYWRDLDKGVVRAKLLAIPLSLMFFLAIAGQFPSQKMQEWTYSVFNKSSSGASEDQPVMVQILQPSREINELVNTAWKIPYEDSLSVVADIDASGSLLIGHVLEYPKNAELLEKVGRTLQQARFDFSHADSDSFVIYSFQKIDVYEGRGL